MSGLGGPTDPQGEAPVGESARDISMWVIRAGVAMALVIAVAVIVGLAQPKPDDAETIRDTTDPSTSFPPEWDSRIAPYTRIVENLRGLDFEHPVSVRFLAIGAFEKTVTTDARS